MSESTDKEAFIYYVIDFCPLCNLDNHGPEPQLPRNEETATFDVKYPSIKDKEFYF